MDEVFYQEEVMG